MTKPGIIQKYAKSATAKATVGESQALAHGAAYPAIVGARFAMIVSILAFLVAAVALAVAVSK